MISVPVNQLKRGRLVRVFSPPFCHLHEVIMDQDLKCAVSILGGHNLAWELAHRFCPRSASSTAPTISTR